MRASRRSWYNSGMAIEIQSLADAENGVRTRRYEGAAAVFWETAAVTDFSHEAAHRQFIYKYLEYYRDAAADLFLVALGPEERVYGYICGVADTRAHPELYRVAEHIPVFDDLYSEYPAHLHINLTADSRGHGLGSRLIHALEERLNARGVRGLHLVTSEGARNVTFYRKNRFHVEIARGLPHEGDNAASRMLFMGKTL